MRIVLLCGLISLIGCQVAEAKPPFKQSLRRYYGDLLPASMQACTTCHLSGEPTNGSVALADSAPPHNSFGSRLAEILGDFPDSGQISAFATGLRTIAEEDTDGDGVANEEEIVTGHAPGDPKDKPDNEQLAAVRPRLSQFRQGLKQYRWEPFRPVVRPPIPLSNGGIEHRNPIDAFLAVEHAAHGLQPRGAAPRAVLLRRVYLDLTGLPPTAEELRTFLADTDPAAYERVVERLLASPRYGERWGRHWMDVWRYSDWAGWTDGKQVRDSQPHIWRWRDWIIESLNADKPYDRMLTEMLAADEMAPSDSAALRATGFLARNYKMLSRETWMQDTVNHTLQAFVGLTVACARCHDHLYDAISQKEYYQLRAIFEPHKVRLDQVASELDTAKDGLARVYDADLESATYLYRRGDEREPDKDHALTPGVLRLLGDASYRVTPVSLPREASYPSLKPEVQQAHLAAAQSEVERAEAEQKQASEALKSAAKSSGGGLAPLTTEFARTKVGVADKILASSRLRLESVKARIAADNAKYADPPAANAQELAEAAAKAERAAASAQAIVDVLQAEAKRLSALAAEKRDDAAKSKQSIADADKAVAEAMKQRDVALQRQGEVTAEYTPLGPVYPRQSSGRRLALARWITDRQNPLAARVAVNQIWLRHFGQPLVPTVLDFGQNGQPPTHPALVDWLASEFMEPTFDTGGSSLPWSMKHLHRLIVTSDAYRRDSTPDDKNLAADPDNRWLWRMPSRRMEAELVRDGILYVAGQLDLAMGGPDIEHRRGLEVKRRSIYFQHAQEKQMEFLKMFDAAAVTECYQRKESIVPQQALALANSELTRVQARIIARRLNEQVADDDQKFAGSAFENVLSRPATAEELRTTVEFLGQQRARLASANTPVAESGTPSADKPTADNPTVDKPAAGESPSDPKKPAADVSLRARESLVHVLLNHHDFVTIR